MRLADHHTTPHVVRTREAVLLMQSLPRGMDAMRSLHNKGQAHADVLSWLGGSNRSLPIGMRLPTAAAYMPGRNHSLHGVGHNRTHDRARGRSAQGGAI